MVLSDPSFVDDVYVVISSIVGVVNAALILWIGYEKMDLNIPRPDYVVSVEVYYSVGLFVMGAGPAYLLLQFGLISPIALAALLALASINEAYTPPSGPVPGEPFTALYLGGWWVFGAVAAAAALGEALLRWVLLPILL